MKNTKNNKKVLKSSNTSNTNKTGNKRLKSNNKKSSISKARPVTSTKKSTSFSKTKTGKTRNNSSSNISSINNRSVNNKSNNSKGDRNNNSSKNVSKRSVKSPQQTKSSKTQKNKKLNTTRVVNKKVNKKNNNNIIDFNKAQKEYNSRNNNNSRSNARNNNNNSRSNTRNNNDNSRSNARNNNNNSRSNARNNNNNNNARSNNRLKNTRSVKAPNTRSQSNSKVIRANRNFSTISTIFMSSMFFLIVLYFGISMIKGLDKPSMDYETIEIGTINNYTQAEGIIIRDEVIYSASKDGVLTINASQLDKVKVNQHIATIKNITETQETEAELELIYSQILEIQEKRADLSLFSEDVLKLEKQIQSTIENNIYTIASISSNEFVKLYELKEMIDKNITNRNQLLLSENSSSLESLASQKISKENELNQNIEVFYSETSGILSYNIDGYEDIFTKDILYDLTKEQTTTQIDMSAFKLDIEAGENVFKIVNDNMFYIASYINHDNISTWKEGQIKTIYVNDLGTLKPLQVTIDTIDYDGISKEAYVVMKSNNNMIDFIDERNISFEINMPKEGYKVKLSAIVVEDLLKIPNSYIIGNSVVLKKGSVISQDGISVNTEVSISIAGISSDELYSYAYIDKSLLAIGDIIINPNNKDELQLNEVETTEGIYVTNTGFNMLKSINIDNSVQDNTYIILDQVKNANIKLYDRYLQDANSIEFAGGLSFTTPTNTNTSTNTQDKQEDVDSEDSDSENSDSEDSDSEDSDSEDGDVTEDSQDQEYKELVDDDSTQDNQDQEDKDLEGDTSSNSNNDSNESQDSQDKELSDDSTRENSDSDNIEDAVDEVDELEENQDLESSTEDSDE